MKTAMTILNGFELIVSEYLPSSFVRVRKHKKKRIDKKYLKRYGWKNKPVAYAFGKNIICNQEYYDLITNTIVSRK